MNFGSNYAAVYDGLYSEKDYASEARFVEKQLRKILSAPDLRVLDLGCGTGRHAVALAKKGISVIGVDRSPSMVAVAERRRKNLPQSVRDRLEFRVGDARETDLGEKFAAIVALFHVVSYMRDDKDLDALLATVGRHLEPHGVFVCDFWNGSAVLLHPPTPRERIVIADGRRVRRMGRPSWDRKRNVVRIDYDLEVTDLATGLRTLASESHEMRYYFPEQLRDRLSINALEVLEFCHWLKEDLAWKNSFSVNLIAQRRHGSP